MIAVAKITAKGQTTIPRKIRDALRVHSGDTIAWEISREGVASVRRLEPADTEYMHAVHETLCEWSSPEDEEAYRDL